MKHIVVYVHGKGGSAEEAEHYKPLFPDSEVIGLDYRARTPWEAKEEFPAFFAAQRQRCDRLTLKPVRICPSSRSEYGQSPVTTIVDKLCATNHRSRK